MNIVEEKVDALKAAAEEAEVNYLERSAQFRLSDAIREGSTVSGQAFAWTDEEHNLCALSAAAVSASAREYI